ncbi:DUF5667 domain-containing protein [Streptomyces zingiberis]|uniref:DUF5667 domain-containing protein n=1 Tax=Streptomyces zingiberis TaxID=2053010 RepID=A0ABX1C5E3_9ACTN|nr:DUF5667 domain-containing protein [Streptomyces zingiberis]NJQ03793.1 hypothetical protein [Streptomyces zingiberis]
MIRSAPAHRRANAFAEALDERRPEPPEDDAELGRMLSVAAGLGELPAPRLDPGVRTVQRAQLVAAVESMFAGGAPAGEEGAAARPMPGQRSGRAGAHARRARAQGRLRPRSRWSQGLAAGGLTVGVAAGAFGGVAAASSDALPGDSLYGLKRGMEDLRRGLADDDREAGMLYLDQAATRMHEASRLMERGRAGELDEDSVGEVRRALSGMRHDASEGHRLLSSAYQRNGSLAPIEALDSFSRAHREGWQSLSGRLPAQLIDVRDEVTAVMDAIEHEVGPLKALLPDDPSAGIPGLRQPSGRYAPSGPGSGTGEPAPPGAAPSESVPGGSEPQPSGSASGPEGESPGGTGSPLDPSGTGSPSLPPGGEATPQPPEITLPPLFPGLLPDFGFDPDARN